MPVGVVECLEVVDVHQNHRKPLALTGAVFPGEFEAFVEQSPVAQAGQPVLATELLQGHIGLMQFQRSRLDDLLAIFHFDLQQFARAGFTRQRFL